MQVRDLLMLYERSLCGEYVEVFSGRKGTTNEDSIAFVSDTAAI